ncbi:protein bicaudal C homolog 1-like isoform X2 [Tigriopus californicus]|uniref:protein bicaudal C homolog 1-like isoform X2 n=1 Tax=Tigriopus californicus TaxID=6832 RepID=UPI0027DA4715|nr:protein bicaudal C homolog 1-like isoform X2 [Tigriopus californicus]
MSGREHPEGLPGWTTPSDCETGSETSNKVKPSSAGDWLPTHAPGPMTGGPPPNGGAASLLPPAYHSYYAGPDMANAFPPHYGRAGEPKYRSTVPNMPQPYFMPPGWSVPPGPESVATTCTTSLSRGSSRDDLTSLMDGRIFEHEERFRVDRRKLELLMLGRFEPIRESASDYFARIGEETNTTVIWPTRLKIGAKSKKDPHIRVGGFEEGVRRAKYRIMTHLDTKNNRVTMKMDVSYTDHSHVIGKGGNTIRRVMAETGCHIHFPDSNRSNPNEKSNQVSIAGEIEGVETARARVRELTPLIFNFDLPIIPSMLPSPNVNEPFLKAIQDQYNIQVTFRQKQKNFHTTMVVIKGCEWEAARVKESTLLLVDHLCGLQGADGGGTTRHSISSNPEEIPVSMNMEISPQHHGVVLGKNNMALKLIMRRTNTTILFPDAYDPNIPSIRKGSVTITGSIHNVYLARQQLIGSLPLVMTFDLPDECVDVDEKVVQTLMSELDVQINIKPKARQLSKSVTIKAHERNATNIYKARSVLLGLGDEHVKATIPENYNIQAVGSGLASELGITLPVNHRPSSSLDCNNNNDMDRDGQVRTPTPLNATPPMLPSSSPRYPSNYAQLVLDNITRLEQQRLQDEAYDRFSRGLFPPRKPEPREKKYAANGAELLPCGCSFPGVLSMDELDFLILPLVFTPDLTGPPSPMSPPIPGASPRNSSPVHEGGNITEQFVQMDLNQTHPLAHENEGRVFKSEMESPRAWENKNDNNNNESLSGSEGDGGEKTRFGDRRAPGCEKKQLGQGPDTNDQLPLYEQKKLQATKARQQKPKGETRTPTANWAGWGFSQSLTDSMLRDKDLSRNEEQSAWGIQRDSIAEEEAGSLNLSLTDNLALKNSSPIPRRTKSTSMAGSSSEAPSYAAAAQGQGQGQGSLSALQEREKKRRGSVSGGGDSIWNQSALEVVPLPNRFINPNASLPKVLTDHGLAQYTDLFLRHELDLIAFSTLDEEDFKELGIQSLGVRDKMRVLAHRIREVHVDNW